MLRQNPKQQLARKVAEKRAQKAPLLLMFHPGGFIMGNKDTIQPNTMSEAKDLGFHARSVEYPLQDPVGALKMASQMARKARRHGREVYTYGESAGGALALRLAQKGLANKASALSPLTNLIDFSNDLQGIFDTAGDPRNADQLLGGTEKAQARVSPLLHKTRKSNPTFVTLAKNEMGGTFDDDISKYGAMDNVTLRNVQGNHISYTDDGSTALHDRIATMALKWLLKRGKNVHQR